MNCPFCKGALKAKKDTIKEDGIDFESYQCVNCKEEILDMKQLSKLAQKYRTLKDAKDITFAKWGNSIAVRIPADVALEYNISSGKHGKLIKDKDGIKILAL